MSTENVLGQEGVEKLKTLVEGTDNCMFCTDLSEQPIHATPMSIQEVDDEGNIWFLASNTSEKYTNISKDNRVQLFFSNPGDYTFLSVYGLAGFSYDQARIDRYWNKMMEGWFEKGREDPSIVLVKVQPEDIRYWETKDNKLVTFAKVLWTAISGQKTNTGNEGKIEI